jgi:hypothetical protein
MTVVDTLLGRERSRSARHLNIRNVYRWRTEGFLGIVVLP